MAFLFTPLSSKAQTLDPIQVYTTGNIVQGTPQGGPAPWVNGVYQNNLTCWGWGDPGYCGPNAIVRPGNNINFSYGMTDLYQIQAIANALPNTGSGLRLNGYNFGFTAKNGNGWDDGRTDYLMAYVSFYDKGGALEYSKNYNLNYKFNWTTFNFSQTFDSPYAIKELGNVRYGFLGMDNNYWAGPYGPEVNNVSFSLKYSVDPCASNTLSSPTCPGYFEELAKLTPQTSNTTVTEPMSPGILTVVDNVAVTTSGVAPLGSVATMDTAPSSTPQSGSPVSAPTPTIASSQPTPSTYQTKTGDVTDSSGSSKVTSSVSLSSVLSMISSNQEKTAALEKSVVQAADAQAFSAGELAKQNAEKVAGDAQSQSMAMGGSGTAVTQSSNAMTLTQTPGTAQSSQLNQINNVANSNRGIQQSLNSGSVQSEVFNFNYINQQQGNLQNSMKQESTVAIIIPSTSYSLVTPSRQSQLVQVEIPTFEGIKFGHKGPVDNAMESKPFLPQMNNDSQQNDTVKRNVQNNEAAGNVTIESIARQPANYAAYFVSIPDVAFYTPKEIYKNQKTIDNARALRQLSSDRLHQDLVNLQYK